MAFDYCSDSDEGIYYHGVDINTYWNDIHSKIKELYPNASFATNFDVKHDIPTLSQESYNVVIIEYLISYLYSRGSSVVSNLFDNLIEYVVANKPTDSPMLLIINDADSIHTGRDESFKLVQKLHRKGYNATYEPMRFKDHQHYPQSEMYPSKKLLFECSREFQHEYCVPLSCESAQMIIEIE